MTLAQSVSRRAESQPAFGYASSSQPQRLELSSLGHYGSETMLTLLGNGHTPNLGAIKNPVLRTENGAGKGLMSHAHVRCRSVAIRTTRTRGVGVSHPLSGVTPDDTGPAISD